MFQDLLISSDEEQKSFTNSVIKLSLTNESNSSIVSVINKLLTNSKTRSDAFTTLISILEDLTIEIIGENSLKWIYACLLNDFGDSLKEQKLVTLAKILKHAPKDQEFNKKFVSDILSRVIDSSISTHINAGEITASLDCLAQCMEYYASSVGPYRNKIETFVMKLLDNQNETIVEKAAICFLKLQQVGGAGIEGINHINNYSIQFRKLCSTIHKLYDNLFENLVEIESVDAIDEVPFEFTEGAFDSQKQLIVNARRIKNCLTFLKIMIQKKFPVVKETKPKDFLNVVTRGLSVHSCLKEENLSSHYFSVLLSNIQIDLLHLLRWGIVWYQSYVLPFSYSITKQIIDCLIRCNKCKCFTANGIYKEAIYKTLISWIKISKSSINSQYQNHLISCVLTDIRPAKSQVVLTLRSNPTSNKKGKHKINQDVVSVTTLTASQKLHAEHNCKFALETLKYIFKTSMLNIKDGLLQEIYTTILNLLSNIQQKNNVIHPYTNVECQALLYEVMVSFYDQDTEKILPPIQTSIHLLHHGLQNKDRFISVICENGLNTLEKLCQPICPSLNLPVVEENECNENMFMDITENGHSLSNGYEEINKSEDVDLLEKEIKEDQEENENVNIANNSKKINILDVQIISTSQQQHSKNSVIEDKQEVEIFNSTIQNTMQEQPEKEEDEEIQIVSISDDSSILNNDISSEKSDEKGDDEEVIIINDVTDLPTTDISKIKGRCSPKLEDIQQAKKLKVDTTIIDLDDSFVDAVKDDLF